MKLHLIYLWKCVCTCACVCKCMRACMCVCLYVCMRACVYVCMSVCAWSCLALIFHPAVCILEYYSRQRDFPRPVKCPVCRQVVTLLLTNFSQEEADNVGDLGQRIHDYNRRCGGAPQTVSPWLSYGAGIVELCGECVVVFVWHTCLVRLERLHSQGMPRVLLQ